MKKAAFLLMATTICLATGWTIRAKEYPSYSLQLNEGAVLSNAEFVPWTGYSIKPVGNNVTVKYTKF